MEQHKDFTTIIIWYNYLYSTISLSHNRSQNKIEKKPTSTLISNNSQYQTMYCIIQKNYQYNHHLFPLIVKFSCVYIEDISYLSNFSKFWHVLDWICWKEFLSQILIMRAFDWQITLILNSISCTIRFFEYLAFSIPNVMGEHWFLINIWTTFLKINNI